MIITKKAFVVAVGMLTAPAASADLMHDAAWQGFGEDIQGRSALSTPDYESVPSQPQSEPEPEPYYSTSAASSTYYLDARSAPLMDSDNPAFIDGVLALNEMCKKSNNFAMDEFCKAVGDAIYSKENMCFSFLKTDFDTTLKQGCQVGVAEQIAGDIYQVFTQSPEIAVEKADPLNTDYVFYAIGETKFAFKNHGPA